MGDIIIQAEEIILPVIDDAVRQRAQKWLHENTNIVIAKYWENSCVIGRVTAIYRNILCQPSEWMT
ncbi:hypothetical protein ACFLXI_05820 [Chloroflexota bacterium]